MADLNIRGKLTGFDDMERGFNGLTNSAEKSNSALSNIAKVGAVALAAAATAVSAAVIVGAKDLLDFGDKVQKLSIATGASTEALSEMKLAAELSGTSFESLAKSWVKQQKGIAEAARGIGTAKDALSDLGLEVEDLIDLKPEEQFDVLADSLLGITNETKKVEIATNLWGKAAVGNLAIVEKGSAGIKEMRMQANQLGLTITENTANSIAEFNDSVLFLQKAMNGLVQSSLIALMPMLNDMAALFKEIALDGDNFKDSIGFLTNTLKGLVTGAVIVKNIIDALAASFASTAAAAVFAAKGEFSLAWQALKEGGKDVQNDFNDVTKVIDKLFNDSKEFVNAANEEIKKSSKTTTEELAKNWAIYEENVKANELAAQKELKAGWDAYNENLEINNQATVDQLDAAWKAYEDNLVINEKAAADEIDAGWAAYYENQAINISALEKSNSNAAAVSRNQFSAMFNAFSEGLESSIGSAEGWALRFNNHVDDMRNFAAGAFDRMSFDFGNNIADMIVDGESFSMKDTFDNMLKQFIAMTVSMAAQWAIMTALVQSGAVTMAASGVAVNVAWGPFTLAIVAIAVGIVALKLAVEKFGPSAVAVGVAVSLAFAPVSATVLAIAAGIALIVIAYENWDKIGSKVSAALKLYFLPVKLLFEQIKLTLELIKIAIEAILSPLETLKTLVNAISNPIDTLKSGFGKVKDIAGDVVGGIKSIFSSGGSSETPVVKTLREINDELGKARALSQEMAGDTFITKASLSPESDTDIFDELQDLFESKRILQSGDYSREDLKTYNLNAAAALNRYGQQYGQLDYTKTGGAFSFKEGGFAAENVLLELNRNIGRGPLDDSMDEIAKSLEEKYKEFLIGNITREELSKFRTLRSIVGNFFTKGFSEGYFEKTYNIPEFAMGGSFLTQGPQLFMAGEQGQERITINPAGTSSSNQSGGGANYIFNGPVIIDHVTARKFSRGQLTGLNSEVSRVA